MANLLYRILLFGLGSIVFSFNVADYTHYLDYLPIRQEGLAAFEDFRTSMSPPSALRNRKLEIGKSEIGNL